MPKIIGFSQQPTTSGMSTVYSAKLECGHLWHEPYYYAPMTAQLGEDKVCEGCAMNAHQEAWLEALDSETVHHIRFSPRFGGTYTFYKLDHTSPSNFFSIGGCYATPAIDKILQRKGLSPISPTEAA